MAIENRIWLTALPKFFRLGGGILGLALAPQSTSADLQKINPLVVYPFEAIAQRLEGTTELRVKVDRNGYVQSVNIEKPSGHKILDQAAVGSVYQWVFNRPRGGAPQQYDIPIQFRITEDSIRELPARDPGKETVGEESQGLPRIFYQSNPFYPYQAARQRLSGKVLLRFVVTEHGYTSDVTVRKSSGHAILDNSAILSVYRWAFTPPQRDGQPVRVHFEVPVNFSLSDR